MSEMNKFCIEIFAKVVCYLFQHENFQTSSGRCINLLISVLEKYLNKIIYTAAKIMENSMFLIYTDFYEILNWLIIVFYVNF